ncbi:hypothetical protein D5018_03955 [Parashewanella curva]|uniref:Uncharacterized protein n=1 Tax=Parashewanella curva TaxID=2338552 RepID=A0A3L8Q042_9GAMM|nr:hypothetical protein [Parashewanella curva]RLV61004.1 hypothetical protein D5018_03955 [Parashewanella curva]
MIQNIIDRLKGIKDFKVKEGFYQQGTTAHRFIFIQPDTSDEKANSGKELSFETIRLQIVAGIAVNKTDTPTAELINVVRDIRERFYKDETRNLIPSWLQLDEHKILKFKEVDVCKFIMPESHETHGLAVLTLEIQNTHSFGERI